VSRSQLSIYDLIKAVIVIVLAAFIYALVNPASRPASIARANLPQYPDAPFSWKYDPVARELLNPQGVQIYSLSSDGSAWEPVIPASLRLELPRETRLVQASDLSWQITDTHGGLIATWNAGQNEWVIGVFVPTSTATSTPTLTLLSTPTAGVSATPRLTPTQIVSPTITLVPTLDCPLPMESRISVGDLVVLLQNLNVHTDPLLSSQVTHANPKDARGTILGGPVCEPYEYSAFLWWKILDANGLSGWVAEASLNGSVYFLEPAK